MFPAKYDISIISLLTSLKFFNYFKISTRIINFGLNSLVFAVFQPTGENEERGGSNYFRKCHVLVFFLPN